MYPSLYEIFAGFIPLEHNDIPLIKTLFQPASLKKDTVLVNKGDISDTAYFINSGYLRYYKYLETGEEQTIHLFSPGEFAASFLSFSENIKSEEILHTITDAEVLCIHKTDLEKLYNTDPKWQLFGRKLMEYLLIGKEKRIIDLLSLTAQERYLKLIEINPGLLKNVPVQYLASFIGIKPESLSRIRKQIS
jgi:CRP-like cAMP-binding protein